MCVGRLGEPKPHALFPPITPSRISFTERVENSPLYAS